MTSLLFTVGIHFSYNFLYTQNIWVAQLAPFSCSYGFLYGVFSYFYIKTHLIRDFKLRKVDWLHFLPFVILIFSVLLGFLRCSKSLGVVLIISMLIYCILSFKAILAYLKTLKNTQSQSPIPELTWLRLLLLVTLCIIALDLFAVFVPEILIFQTLISSEIFVQLGVLLIVNLVTLQALKNPHFFQQVTKKDLKLNESISEKSQKQPNSHKGFDHIQIQNIENYIKDQKPYLEAELSLDSLANQLKLHPKNLSQIINQHFKVNFSEYINHLRIEEAKSIFENNQDTKLTIKEVMYDCGFNSRSVFNTLFKKKTGMTPSQFRKILKL